MNGTGNWSVPSNGSTIHSFSANGTILVSDDVIILGSAVNSISLPASASTLSKFFRIKSNSSATVIISVGASETGKITDTTGTVVDTVSMIPGSSGSFIYDGSTYQVMN